MGLHDSRHVNGRRYTNIERAGYKWHQNCRWKWTPQKPSILERQTGTYFEGHLQQSRINIFPCLQYSEKEFCFLLAGRNLMVLELKQDRCDSSRGCVDHCKVKKNVWCKKRDPRLLQCYENIGDKKWMKLDFLRQCNLRTHFGPSRKEKIRLCLPKKQK